MLPGGHLEKMSWRGICGESARAFSEDAMIQGFDRLPGRPLTFRKRHHGDWVIRDVSAQEEIDAFNELRRNEQIAQARADETAK